MTSIEMATLSQTDNLSPSEPSGPSPSGQWPGLRDKAKQLASGHLGLPIALWRVRNVGRT